MTWRAPRDSRHGRPPVFSDAAIQFSLSIKVLFKLPLCRTAGMVVIRWATRKGTLPGTWLHAMLLRKPRKVVAIALANKMARALWAMETRKEDYQDPL